MGKGVRGYKNRKMRHEKDGQILRRTAKQSWIARLRKKLLEKTTGYKGERLLWEKQRRR